MRLCGLTLVAGIAVFGADSTQTMMKLSVRIQSPNVPEGSFGAKPKVMYRAGNRYCRTEEMADPEHGIHGLMIINEPDIWMVNLLTNTARHLVDPGPTFNCRMPIFIYGEDVKSAGDLKNPLFELEFGRELEYFKGKGAPPNDGPVLQGKATKAYSIEAGDSRLFLFTIGTPERPLAVARQHNGAREIYWYGVYEEVPFDSKLFARPTGVEIEEGNHLWKSAAPTK